LSNRLRLADLSLDKSKLYLFSDKESNLAIIDLNTLQLQEKIPFEKEGPNGVGSNLWEINTLPDEKLLIKTFQEARIFDLQGQKEADIQLKVEDVEGIDDSKQLQNNNLRISQDLKRYYTIPGSVFDFDQVMEFAVIDRNTMEGSLMKLPALDITLAFSLILTSKGMMQAYTEDIFYLDQNGRYFISSSATSDIYAYDPQVDSLLLFSFPIQTVPKAKSDPPKQKQVTDRDQWNSEMEKINAQVKFSPLLWDETRNYFFRLASTITGDIPGGKTTNEVFLLAFNSDMKLVGETIIEGLNHIPDYPFYKDGKLWSYVNVEDELGFAVFTLKF